MELAQAAGLRVDNGIVVDAQLRTADPRILAVGDVASFHHPLFERRIRLESWKNAEVHAAIAAANVLGRGVSIEAAPWFWSDQYDHNLQIAGLPDLGARTVVRDVSADVVVCFHLTSDGRLMGASGIGPAGAVGRDVRAAQLLIERRAAPDPQTLADPDAPLKRLLRA